MQAETRHRGTVFISQKGAEEPVDLWLCAGMFWFCRVRATETIHLPVLFALLREVP
jgi:hypothetical protein